MSDTVEMPLPTETVAIKAMPEAETMVLNEQFEDRLATMSEAEFRRLFFETAYEAHVEKVESGYGESR